MAEEPEATAPQASSIPPEAIERWASLPSDRPLAIGFTKVDFDNLFLGLRGMVVASSYLESAVAALHRQDPTALSEAFTGSHDALAISFNQINDFITAAMIKAAPYRGPADE